MGTYNSGLPYRVARGQRAGSEGVVDAMSTVHPVVTGMPSSREFIRLIVRELKIRAYQKTTIKTYKNVLAQFLCWFEWPPHRVDGEAVRCYLELLADSGKSSSTLAINVSAIRTAFDKFCGRNVTRGLATPRPRHRLPVVPSRSEVERLLAAATADQDKVLMGLIYATGLRVSEVARLRWADLDFDNMTVFVRCGKGKSDRVVGLPRVFEAQLRLRSQGRLGSDFLFPAGNGRAHRHLSSRTIERIVTGCQRRAQIGKRLTPHSLRHAFATHLLEGGVDIRFIQKLLGHVRLETTSIYTHVAHTKINRFCTPLDSLVDV